MLFLNGTFTYHLKNRIAESDSLIELKKEIVQNLVKGINEGSESESGSCWPALSMLSVALWLTSQFLARKK